MSDWGQRAKRGKFARLHPLATAKAIDNLWTWSPSSSALQMALTCLNQVTPKSSDPEGSYHHDHCTRCGTKSARTPLHRTRGCPHNGPDNRRLEALIDRLTGFQTDRSNLQADGSIPTQQGTLPSALPDLVLSNRNAINTAIKSACGITTAGRTLRLPLLNSEGQTATIDSLTDTGQIAMLYTLTSQASAPPTPPPTPALHETGPTKAQGPLFALFKRPSAPLNRDRRWGNRGCYACDSQELSAPSCAIHRVCPRHRPPADTRCHYCDYARTTPITATPASIARTMDRLILHTLTQPGHTLMPTLRDICRQILRTYSDMHLNPLTARHPWDTSWLTNDQGCVALGGTYHEAPTDFLRDRYTFICPTEPTDELRNLAAAAAAVQSANGPTRSAHVMSDTTTARGHIHALRTKHTHIHILAHFPPGAIGTYDSRLMLDDQCHPQESNDVAMILVLLETADAPGFRPQDLDDLLGPLGATTIHSTPPWTYHSLPPDIERPGPAPEPPPSHPLLRPSTLFLRGDREYTSLTQNHFMPPALAPRARPADLIPNTLCQMGITPPGFQKAITKATELMSSDYSTSATQIAKIIFDSSLALFLKDEGYHKWKRKT